MPAIFRSLAVWLVAALGPAVLAAGPVPKWEIWDDCHLAADKYFDGDSFRVAHGSQETVLRLYFVDTPETDAGYGERVKEQAAYFRTNQAAVLRGGVAAREFTARFLGSTFRVITRRQIAPGASRDARYYGIVVHGGVRLDTALVEAGLARTTSEIAAYPDLAAGQKTARELRLLEAFAVREKRGLWKLAGSGESLADAIKPRLGGALAARMINLNTATSDELSSLPGVGPKTAGQIIRARPLKDLAALDALPGFGPKKMEALRELVSF